MGAKSETAVERVKKAGVRSAPLVDLIAVGLSANGTSQAKAESAARELMLRANRFRELSALASTELRRAGLTSKDALRCQAWMEIGRRLGSAGKGPPDTISGPDDVAKLLEDLRDEKKEHFVVILLDSRGSVMRSTVVHIGTLTMSVVGPREVFREAIRDGASSIVVAHNHPSGDPTPSPEDVQITEKLAEIGRMLDIPLMDHVVLGEREFVSLRERGLLR